MKYKVKLVGVKNDIVTLRVDGVEYCYFIQRPTPLSLVDSRLLRNMMDTNILESLIWTSGYVNPQERLYQRFCRLVKSWRRRDRVSLYSEGFFGLYDSRDKPTLCDAIANYIEKVGVKVNIDKKTGGLVILKSDVGKIREGKI